MLRERSILTTNPPGARPDGNAASPKLRLTFLTVLPSPYQRDLFRALNASGRFEVRVHYYTMTSRDHRWLATPATAFESVLPGRTLKWLGASAHWNPGIMRAIDADDADLHIVSDYSAPTAQVAMRHLTRRRRPWVFWGERPGFQSRGRVGTMIRNVLQRPLRDATAIAAIGTWAVPVYQRALPGKPVFNIPYFCDLAPYRAARRAAAGARRETIDVLFSGQFIERKGIDILLAAFLQIARERPRLRLLLLGDGPLRSAIAAGVPDDLKDRVVFLGFRQPAELPEVFAAADMFVLPSRHDGWGVVVNEAVGAGLPVIVSDRVGAAHDLVVDGVNGFVVPAADVGALAGALRRLAASADLRLAFAAASTAMAQAFDLDTAVDRWADLSRQVLRHDVTP